MLFYLGILSNYICQQYWTAQSSSGRCCRLTAPELLNFIYSPCVCVDFLQNPPTSQNMSKRMWIGYFKLPLSVIVSACVCVCERVWHRIQDVFPPHAQCPWNRLLILHDPDQDETAAENE